MNQKEYNTEYYRNRLCAEAKARFKKNMEDPNFRAKVKAERELVHFGIPREVIFRKTKGKCFFCKHSKASIVHHLKGDGRTNESRGINPGKDPDSLIGVCRACHIDLHRAEMMLVKKTRANGFWARNYAACIECGSSERKHHSKGLCINCAARNKRREKGAACSL